MVILISYAPPLFRLGLIIATPGVLERCPEIRLAECLAWHARGDWGSVSNIDAQANERALRGGSRILSAYPIDPKKPCKGYGANTLWIITEGDRSATTLLLPSEY